MKPTRAAVAVWLVLVAWSSALHLRATFDPPAGTAFVGTFAWVDDTYNYLSYVQQAADGHLLFRNKLLDPRTAESRLLNLEWLLVGVLSRWLGLAPLLVYRLLAAVATLALVVSADRWLRWLGVPGTRRGAALALVGFGGGLGGLLFELTPLEIRHCLDLSLGAFPFLEVLQNPHFVAGTTLLSWSLWCLSALPGWRGQALGVLLGSVLGLLRPYDLALLGLARGSAVLLGEPPRNWLRALLPLLALLPVLAYDATMLLDDAQFASFQAGAPLPPALAFVPMLAPALGLALAAAWRARATANRRATAPLAAWAAASLGTVAFLPGSFSLQFVVGMGFPLLLLAAPLFATLSVQAGWLLVVTMSTSAVVATRIALTPDPNWFVPRERLAAGRALAAICTRDDRLLAPPDVSLYAIGSSACHAYVAHPAAPEYAAHLRAAGVFYSQASAAERAALLDEAGITVLALPGEPGERAAGWLGATSVFRAWARVGQGRRVMTLYRRSPPGP